jgi:transcriptional regulator with XRE-family HTH domain
LRGECLRNLEDMNQTETSQALRLLFNKIILYRFTRNLDRELKSRKITHSELSEATGRAKNWFNRVFNELEDIRISTFIRLYAAMSKLAEEKRHFQATPLTFDTLFDEDVLRLASLSLDLRTDDIEELIKIDTTLADFIMGLRFYVEILKGMRNVVSVQETEAFENLARRIESHRR